MPISHVLRSRKERSINSIVINGLCVGCGTCVVLCPNKSLNMKLDERTGTYIPTLNKYICTNCGLCQNICPSKHMLNYPSSPNEIGKHLTCYTCFSSNNNLRYNASSGGIATQLLIYALESGIIDGALVVRMKSSKPLEAEPFIARTPEDILSASKSKYCPVPTNLGLTEIISDILNSKYAVVGLPCQIRGIRSAELINSKLKDKIILHISLLCGGMTTYKATDYLLHRHKLNKEDIISFDYRGKGWPGNMSIAIKDKDNIILPYPNYWEEFGSFFIPRQCMLCTDSFGNESDISIGDAWLPEIKLKDNIGTSIAITRTEISDLIINKMNQENKIHLYSLSIEETLNSQQGILQKQSQLQVRRKIVQLFGKKVPYYDNKTFSISFLSYFLNYIYLFQCTLASLASVRNCWFILDAHKSLLNFAVLLKRSLTRFRNLISSITGRNCT